ncbi:hypothetical protein JH06_4861 [Blastocystis sp. subtype 4]|uniref:hypothetical protein n=1 Tax=Blastocystis sp. subtype 4 TaxID=944170 RepID=UPI000711D403|nr:hypothetical protein JH06_4861 [Blastocystis sp. subtype 4]KNB41673.1 hypothetical protein JH06_4861 [Blastocystis sp. subtype 4]|eukprot:XP_014525116.1 hypothetical protein JH06_4861 [Blastocystis sp. subtype 4]
MKMKEMFVTKDTTPAVTVPRDPSFDPTKPIVIPSIQLPPVTMKQEQRLEELQKKKAAMEAVIPERCLCVFKVDTGINPRNFGENTYKNMMKASDETPDIVEEKEEVEEDEQSDASLIREIASRKQKRLEENKQFRTKAKRELEALEKQRVFKRTTIRVHLPDQTIIQAYFAPRETLGDVMSVVQAAFQEQYRTLPFYLFNAPPKVILKPDIQLRSARMVPAAMVYLGWEQRSPNVDYLHYILPEYIMNAPVVAQVDRGSLIEEEKVEAKKKGKLARIFKSLRL